MQDKAGNAVEEQPPLLVDRRNPAKPLELDASLQSSVVKEPVLEFAAIFSSIRLLPTAMANAVPSHSSGAALAPPAAFQVRQTSTGNPVYCTESSRCLKHNRNCHLQYTFDCCQVLATVLNRKSSYHFCPQSSSRAALVPAAAVQIRVPSVWRTAYEPP